MSTTKVAISLDEELLKKLDRLVKNKKFANRSQAIQLSVKEKLERMEHSRLARECLKLDTHFEQTLAEEGFSGSAKYAPFPHNV
jgi:metal-responsive CopG/Arc/MetJ family transcriptional regulator